MTAAGGSLSPSKNRKLAFALRWIFLLALFSLCALLICSPLAEHAQNSILSQVRDEQLGALDKAREEMGEWREKILGDVRIFSNLSVFKNLAAHRLRGMNAEKLLNPDFLRSAGADYREMAGELFKAKKILEEFVNRKPWLYASLLPANGPSLAAAGAIPPLDDEKTKLVSRVLASGQVEFGLPIQMGQTLAVPICAPIFGTGHQGTEPAAFLLLATEAEGLSQNLTSSPQMAGTPLEILAIFQDGTKFFMIKNVSSKPVMTPVSHPPLAIANMAFAEREALDGAEKVFSRGIALNNPRMLLLAQTPADAVTPAIKSQWIKIYVLAFVICLALSFLLAWLHTALLGRKLVKDIGIIGSLSDQARDQKVLLDTINSSLGIGLLIFDGNGNVGLGNQAFMDICDGKGDLRKGEPLGDFLSPKLAEAILKDMRIVNDAHHSATLEVTLPDKNGGTDKICRVSLYPASGHGDGGIAIFQDITQQRHDAKISRERQLALISALARAIESIDPNLVGHSEKLENVSNLLGQALRLEENELETLRLSARLSQVGKLFVPRNLLLKKGKLTPEELAEVRRAPEYGDKILSTLHFDLPVRETTAMIGEKLDGSGKPNGLMGDEISIMGRILAIANAFIAMTSPRAWREGGSLDIDEALTHLRAEEGFDQHVVNTLAALSRDSLARAIGRENGQNKDN